MWFRAYANGYTLPDQTMIRTHAALSALGIGLATIAANTVPGFTLEIGLAAYHTGAVIGEALRTFK